MEYIILIVVIVFGYVLITKNQGKDTNDEYMNSMDTESYRFDDELEIMKTLPIPSGIYSETNIKEFFDDNSLMDNVEENYYYGKKIYEEKFGEINDTPLSDVIKNLNDLYLTDYYKGDEIPYDFRVKNFIYRMGESYKRWNVNYYGGKNIISTNDGMKEVIEEGYEKYFRKEICKSKEQITDDELIEYHMSYIDNPSEKETRIIEINKLKRIVNKEFCVPLKESKYDKVKKSWDVFDINGVFLRVRGLMIDTKNPIPSYVWKLINGNPFDRIYRICKDYMKWSGTKRITKIVFDNVCKWENGEIFREGESQKEYEYPLWINWNKVGKDFLIMKTKLKKENQGGVDWLKNEVGGYLIERKKYYDSFGSESEYFISDELIEKFDKIK